MTSVKNHKTATVLVAIAALAGVLVSSTVAIGSGHIALADDITKLYNNKGISVPTHTNQKQECDTAGGRSGITNSCTAASRDTITQSGGILKK